MISVDITIVGAGPTGLLSAILARQQGLSVCILETRSGPLEVGRADALNARTQQILDVVGVLRDLRPHGLLCNTSSIFKDGRFQSHNNKWWTSLQNTRYKEFLMIGQAEVEKALVKHLDIDVQYNTTVKSVIENVDGVSTAFEGGSVYSKYVIAADGAHSLTRKFLEIEFRGEKPNMCWAVLDTFIQTDFPVCDEIISFEQNGESRVSWIPRERGMARFYVLLEGEVNQERAEESIRRHMAPCTVEFTRTEWFSTYNVQERVAETFISRTNQRIFLAGDSAHVHAVNGGQGLNTGLSDAFALAWRLALCCKSFDKKLLLSYDDERRTTAQGVVKVAGKLVRSTLRSAQEYVELIEKSAGNITGMGIVYPPTSTAIAGSSIGDFVAGARCPDFTLIKSGVVTIRFYELLRYGKFIILKPSVLQLELSLKLKECVEVWEISNDGNSYAVSMPSMATLKTVFDLGAGNDMAVVVRPDLYIGYVGREVTTYFSGFLF